MRGASLAGASVGVQLRYLAYDDDVSPPYVENMNPASGATLVNVTGSIVMRVKDYKNNSGIEAGSGVSMVSLRVNVSYGSTSNTYNSGSTALTASGASFNRLITIDPEDDFPGDTRISVAVDAEDLHVPPNVMDTFRYSFRTAPTSSSSSSSASATPVTSESSAARRGGGNPGNVSPGTHLVSAPESGGTHPLRSGDSSHAFDDVAAGSWYEEAIGALVGRGVIGTRSRFFRPQDGTARGELAKMLVILRGVEPPRVSVSIFTDVHPGMWYGPYMEAAARKGWVKGYGNCMGKAFCFTHPTRTVTRAEAATMIARAYGIPAGTNAPEFADVPARAWFAPAIDAVAARCILRGDDATGHARPHDTVTRAEIAVMLERAERGMRYGKDCGQ